MKVTTIKRMLTGALAAALVMAPVMNVSAATETNTGETVVESVVEIPNTSVVAGTKTTAPGAYLATSVEGTAITSETAAIAEGYGLTGTEKPYAKLSDMDVKKSPLAKAAVDAAAASQGAEVGPMLNVELGKMSAGKYSLLDSEGPEIRLSFGIPKNFKADGATYAVVCVRAGGVVSILEDVDDNPNTVTFDTTGGAGVYAIIRY